MEEKEIKPQTAGSDQDMPRERLLTLGAQALSDYELLAILLRTGIAGKAVLEFSRELLKTRGGVVGLLNSRYEHLAPVKGLGKAKIAQILAVSELCKRFIGEEIEQSVWQFCSPEDVRKFLLMHYKGLEIEELGIILLNQDNRFLAYEKLAMGGVGSVVIPVRELIRLVLVRNAAAVLLIHNHPGGTATPSEADISETKQLDVLLKRLDIRFLDHFIVAGNQLISLREKIDW